MRKFLILSLFCAIVSVNCTAQDGDNIYDDTYIHIVEINSIEPLSYNDFHTELYNSHQAVYWDYSGEKPYFHAVVAIDGNIVDSVGLRYKGISSFEAAPGIEKYALKIDLNEFVSGQSYDGIKKINLNNNIQDVSCMRAKLASEIMNRMGIAAPRVAHAKVYVNGSYRGIYSLVEQIDKTFVRNNYAADSTGYLHKAWGLSIGYGTPTWGGQDTSQLYLSAWSPLKTKQSTNNYQPLREFIDACNNLTDLEFENDVNGMFDLETFIEQQAINMTLSDRDHYCLANWNFYMYLNPEDNKWYMIPWDYDLSFGTQIPWTHIDNPADPNLYNQTSDLFDQDRCLLNRRMFDSPSLKNRYHEALCEVINYGMDSLWINNRIDEIRDLIGTEVENDPFFHNISSYNTYLNDTLFISGTGNWLLDGVSNQGIREYINQRFQEVRQSLLDNGFDCNSATIELDEDGFSNSIINIYPNPAIDIINIDVAGNLKYEATIFDLQGRIMIREINKSAINIQTLPHGTYLIEIEDLVTGQKVIEKIIKKNYNFKIN